MTLWAGYRLQVDGAAGVENMAVDEGLVSAYRAKTAGPTWRVYSWTGPAITFGHFLTAPDAPGVPSARRITGGGYVPHGADITYAVVRERRAGHANYEDIVDAVAAALRRAGVPAEIWRSRVRGRNGFCFASLAPFDIHVGGKKIAGCAQRRFKDVILHHGSIADGPPPAVLRELGFWDPAANVTVEDLTGARLGVAGFSRLLAEVCGFAAVALTTSR